MNYTSLLYWFTVLDGFKIFLTACAIISTIVCVVCFLVWMFDNFDRDSVAEIPFKWFLPITIFFALTIIFVPSRKDLAIIIIGGETMNFLANDSTAKQIPHDLLVLCQSEIKNIAKEAQTELKINTQKEEILDKAKNMSKDELLKTLKSDTTFAKIVLNK